MSKRTTESSTSTAWMLRIFKNGKWECDLGEYFDREDVEEAISRRVKNAGEEYVPVKITTVTTVEY